MLKGGKAVEDEKKDDEDGVTSSNILPNPPSHLLAGGQNIFLPKPTSKERSFFFQRAIASHQLVSAHKKNSDSTEKDNATGALVVADTSSSGSKSDEGRGYTAGGAEKDKDKDDDEKTKIHPLAVASARVDGVGVAELSKAINLGTLVASNDYFGWANIVSQDAGTTGAAASSTTEKTQEDAKTEGGKTSSSTDAPSAERLAKLRMDSNLRAGYLLKRKYSAFHEASSLLTKQKRRLASSVKKQRLIDRRYIELRRRWRIVAPEHGTRVVGPVRADEVVAIDVETYDRDRTGGGNTASAAPTLEGGGTTSSSGSESIKRRLARMIPRFAIIELEQNPNQDDDDEEGDDSHRDKNQKSSSSGMDDKSKPLPSNDDEQQQTTNTVDEKSSTTTSSAEIVRQLSKQLGLKTKTLPHAVVDPSLGKMDLNFDPNKVPVWTLQLKITNVDGVTASCTLADLMTTSDDSDDLLFGGGGGGDKQNNMEKNDGGDPSSSSSKGPEKKKKTTSSSDEKLIESLQHSLFCASLFDAIQHEIATAHSTANRVGSSSAAAAKKAAGTSQPQQGSGNNTGSILSINKRSRTSATTGTSSASTASTNALSGTNKNRPTVWISSSSEHKGHGSDETYLPPPLMMASAGVSNTGMSTTEFCIIYCQEGEVKVQLNPEYTLTIKLMELSSNSTSGSSTDKNKEHHTPSPARVQQEQLQSLCRALLLHAQFVYHEHQTATKQSTTTTATVPPSQQQQQMSSALLPRKKTAQRSTRILEHCVGFGSKVLLEQKLRHILKEFQLWLKKEYGDEDDDDDNENETDKLVVEWLPLSFFGSHSYLSLLVGDVCKVDVHLHGGSLSVKTCTTVVKKKDVNDEHLAVSHTVDGGTTNLSSSLNTITTTAYQMATFSSAPAFLQFLKLSVQKTKNEGM